MGNGGNSRRLHGAGMHVGESGSGRHGVKTLSSAPGQSEKFSVTRALSAGWKRIARPLCAREASHVGGFPCRLEPGSATPVRPHRGRLQPNHSKLSGI
jgi:hypothetical protein